MNITISDFYCRGTRCSGWLYLPDGIENPPIIIMAHGFAGIKTFRLTAFAQRFVEQGFAVFLFDYRCFGESDGQPRNYVHPLRHLQDWEAAIKHVRTISTVNTTKVVLWGTSFSGGHVLITAARDHGIAAVISQVPFVDGVSSARTLGVTHIIRAIKAGLLDIFHMMTVRDPYYVPVVSRPDAFAAMNTPECWDAFMALVPDDSDWENKVPARVLLMIPFYNPGLFGNRILCPVLMVGAEHDSLVPVRSVRRTAARIKDCELAVLDCNHFAPYLGEVFEKNIAIQTEFLKRRLFM